MRSILCLSGRERWAVESSGLLSVLNGAGRGPLLNIHPYPAGHSMHARVCVCVLLSVTCVLKSHLRIGRRERKKPEAARLDLDSGMMFPLRSLTVLRKLLLFPYLAAWWERCCGDSSWTKPPAGVESSLSPCSWGSCFCASSQARKESDLPSVILNLSHIFLQTE